MEQLHSTVRRWVVAAGVVAALSIAGTAQAQDRGPYYPGPPPHGWNHHHHAPPGYWRHRPPPGYYYGAPPVVVAPPPVYYAPPPPPVVYGAPGLNIVIPIR